mmetsp:Transcript_67778/g.107426  ORF Transcript_67778/g.107426 Transcript_67778/m.107426 type:complete len:181 (-) Transcript_67778:38-580(-)|eukprot:CAMPEP_0169085964 /NCGR_PEP_ID=MMETSP1015-20121227/13443_1 /TAXON_ID=342587 /ORGANISM="Karlodinium micrum, Strain CCMP2283" /LENGTH=180 /DNA_ID=CAMNT_0009146091 /DNA_START=49 /DNA_END=591 /DNA_ORIENTATION=+
MSFHFASIVLLAGLCSVGSVDPALPKTQMHIASGGSLSDVAHERRADSLVRRQLKSGSSPSKKLAGASGSGGGGDCDEGLTHSNDYVCRSELVEHGGGDNPPCSPSRLAVCICTPIAVWQAEADNPSVDHFQNSSELEEYKCCEVVQNAEGDDFCKPGCDDTYKSCRHPGSPIPGLEGNR